jgi:hypothetical protein
LNDRSLKGRESLAILRGEMERDTSTPSRLTHDRDFARITAEQINLLFDPA